MGQTSTHFSGEETHIVCVCTALSVALFAYGGSNVLPKCQNSGGKMHEGSAGLKTSTKEEC